MALVRRDLVHPGRNLARLAAQVVSTRPCLYRHQAFGTGGFVRFLPRCCWWGSSAAALAGHVSAHPRPHG